jgi:tetratricopeptide (TPR) repeat protein
MLRPALAVVFLVSAIASADPASDKQRAGELAAESAQHYKRGEFEVSAALLRKAYGLYPEPNLLYNLARSLEGMGDKAGAVEAYDQYLETAKQVEDRGAVERHVATLKAELVDKMARTRPREKPHEPAAPPQPEPAPPPAPPPPEPAPHVDHEGPSKAPWVAIIGGVGIAGGGGVLAYIASQRHDQAVAAPVATDAQRLNDEAHQFATIANVMFAAGAVVTVAGIVWEIHEHNAHHDVAVRATPTSVALEVTW